MLENRKDNAIMRRVRKNVIVSVLLAAFLYKCLLHYILFFHDVDDGQIVYSNREKLVDIPITFPIEEPEKTYQEKDLNGANYDMYSIKDFSKTGFQDKPLKRTSGHPRTIQLIVLSEPAEQKELAIK